MDASIKPFCDKSRFIATEKTENNRKSIRINTLNKSPIEGRFKTPHT